MDRQSIMLPGYITSPEWHRTRACRSGSRAVQCPSQELNLILKLRKLVCYPAHPWDVSLAVPLVFGFKYLARESNPVLWFRRPPCFPHTRKVHSCITYDRKLQVVME